MEKRTWLWDVGKDVIYRSRVDAETAARLGLRAHSRLNMKRPDASAYIGSSHNELPSLWEAPCTSSGVTESFTGARARPKYGVWNKRVQGV